MTDTPKAAFGWPALVAVALIAAAAAVAVQSVLDKDDATEAVPTAAVTPQPAAEAPRRSPPARVAPTAENAERIKQEAEEFRATLESRFVADTLDPEWSGKAETEVVAAAAEPALEQFGTPSDLRARCSGHMCRIEIDFDNAVSAADWASFYPTSLAGTLSAVHTAIEPMPDGGSRVVLIGARIGYNDLMTRPRAADPALPAATPPQPPSG